MASLPSVVEDSDLDVATDVLAGDHLAFLEDVFLEDEEHGVAGAVRADEEALIAGVSPDPRGDRPATAAVEVRGVDDALATRPAEQAAVVGGNSEVWLEVVGGHV